MCKALAKRLHASLDAILHNQNLRANLRWVAKRIRKSARKITCDQLVSTCAGCPNGKKLASTYVQIWAQPKSTQVDASRRKSMQVAASRRKSTQVGGQTSPFGQGLRLYNISKMHAFPMF